MFVLEVNLCFSLLIGVDRRFSFFFSSRKRKIKIKKWDGKIQVTWDQRRYISPLSSGQREKHQRKKKKWKFVYTFKKTRGPPQNLYIIYIYFSFLFFFDPPPTWIVLFIFFSYKKKNTEIQKINEEKKIMHGVAKLFRKRIFCCCCWCWTVYKLLFFALNRNFYLFLYQAESFFFLARPLKDGDIKRKEAEGKRWERNFKRILVYPVSVGQKMKCILKDHHTWLNGSIKNKKVETL